MTWLERLRHEVLRRTRYENGHRIRRVRSRGKVSWQNRAPFYGIAAKLMRRILVDHARARNPEERGGLLEKIALDEAGDLPAGCCQ